MGGGIYNDQGGFSAVKSIRDSADSSAQKPVRRTARAMPMEQWYINVLNDVPNPDGLRYRSRYQRRALRTPLARRA